MRAVESVEERRRERAEGGNENPHLIFFLSLFFQVYRARVRATGQEVAVKVQRPAALSTISKVRKGEGCPWV